MSIIEIQRFNYTNYLSKGRLCVIFKQRQYSIHMLTPSEMEEKTKLERGGEEPRPASCACLEWIFHSFVMDPKKKTRCQIPTEMY